jgi:hypothetical protein
LYSGGKPAILRAFPLSSLARALNTPVDTQLKPQPRPTVASSPRHYAFPVCQSNSSPVQPQVINCGSDFHNSKSAAALNRRIVQRELADPEGAAAVVEAHGSCPSRKALFLGGSI